MRVLRHRALCLAAAAAALLLPTAHSDLTGLEDDPALALDGLVGSFLQAGAVLDQAFGDQCIERVGAATCTWYDGTCTGCGNQCGVDLTPLLQIAVDPKLKAAVRARELCPAFILLNMAIYAYTPQNVPVARRSLLSEQETTTDDTKDPMASSAGASARGLRGDAADSAQLSGQQNQRILADAEPTEAAGIVEQLMRCPDDAAFAQAAALTTGELELSLFGLLYLSESDTLPKLKQYMETYCGNAPLTVEQLVINSKIVPDLGAPLDTPTCVANKMAVEAVEILENGLETCDPSVAVYKEDCVNGDVSVPTRECANDVLPRWGVAQHRIDAIVDTTHAVADVCTTMEDQVSCESVNFADFFAPLVKDWEDAIKATNEDVAAVKQCMGSGCSKTFEQCNGDVNGNGDSSRQCCHPDDVCLVKNASYASCQPPDAAEGKPDWEGSVLECEPRPQTLQQIRDFERTGDPVCTGACVETFGQCAGHDYSGSQRCCSDADVCLEKDTSYAQCRPKSKETREGWRGTIIDCGAAGSPVTPTTALDSDPPPAVETSTDETDDLADASDPSSELETSEPDAPSQGSDAVDASVDGSDIEGPGASAGESADTSGTMEEEPEMMGSMDSMDAEADAGMAAADAASMDAASTDADVEADAGMASADTAMPDATGTAPASTEAAIMEPDSTDADAGAVAGAAAADASMMDTMGMGPDSIDTASTEPAGMEADEAAGGMDPSADTPAQEAGLDADSSSGTAEYADDAGAGTDGAEGAKLVSADAANPAVEMPLPESGTATADYGDYDSYAGYAGYDDTGYDDAGYADYTGDSMDGAIEGDAAMNADLYSDYAGTSVSNLAADGAGPEAPQLADEVADGAAMEAAADALPEPIAAPDV